MPHHLTDLRIFQIGISLNFSFSNKTQVISSTSISYIGFPWDSPGKNTGVGCRFLLQGIFPTQGLNPGLPHCRQTLYHLSPLKSCNDKGNSILWFSSPKPVIPVQS